MTNIFDKVISNDDDVKKFVEMFKDYKPYCIEQSTKVSKTSLMPNRIAIGFNKKSMTKQEVIAMAKALGIPDIHQATYFYNQYDTCSSIGFGLEKNESNSNYRMYFEKELSDLQKDELKAKHIREVPTIEGLKWYSDQATSHFDTTIYYSQLYNETQEDRDNLINKAKFSFIPKIFSLDKTPDIMTNYFAVTRGLVERNAFYIRMDCPISELTNDILTFTECDLKQELQAFADANVNMSAISGSSYSHNRESESLTIYFIHHDNNPTPPNVPTPSP
jgi:hypothetical protein